MTAHPGRARPSSPPVRSRRRRCREALQRRARRRSTSTSTTRSRPSSPPTRSTCTVAWKASRYDKGGDDYVNCPLDRDEYYAFVDAVAGGGEGADARLRALRLLRGLHADRGDGAPRAATRSPSGRCGRSGSIDPRTGTRAVRRACSSGRTTPRADALQHGRLPDEDDVPRAAARLPHDPGPRAGRVRAARQPAPQHLRRRAVAAAAVAAGDARASACCWPGRSSASRATSSRRPPGLLAGLNVARLVRGEPPARAAAHARRSARCSRTSRSAAARISSR